MSSGLLVVAYDLNNNGKPDFFALRVIIRSYYSTETIGQIKVNYPKNFVFDVAYEEDTYYYITNPMPLFYVIDVNEDGLWDVMYKDEMEDGVNGNEKFYDSPSGLFTESPINALK